ncbi:heme-degrading monooxygenase HmoA [Phenylobacterium haematophilum]|uniref:Heme-degrading monooxygenase HmoA n=1 Tax=Phenylobacterium haematophilum TaxID=98513 RepID=A0A839ZVQ1_9CAUL|nr:antibiotic biosynthesis monooxygenase [Phenylobacterium haematophilum]MBB3890565.1 heme-degrading monooxygenase HmoA [Phenylobacterium haematophilum]
MIAVIFEVWPAANGEADYLSAANRLRAELETIDGFISIERFASLAEEGKLLSLSFWRDEEAIERWRGHLDHREAQAAGRAGVFTNYRLRVGEVDRDYGMFDRAQAPLT